MQTANVSEEVEEMSEEVQELNKKVVADANEVNEQTDEQTVDKQSVDKQAVDHQGRKRAVSGVSS